MYGLTPATVTACNKRMSVFWEQCPFQRTNLGKAHFRWVVGLPVWTQAGGLETAIYSFHVFPLPDWQTRD